MPATARHVKKVQFIVASLMKPRYLNGCRGSLCFFMSEHESFVKQKLSGVALRSKDPERSEWARLALLCERVQRMSGFSLFWDVRLARQRGKVLLTDACPRNLTPLLQLDLQK